ncbi:oxidoreductase [Paenibacillus sp. SSG-1]|uniref:SDR family NAD(P)-dependent oxidoreductase n=1 Tax=Paenibacillus sp. SSG-1 TaxID=1443669 RepID=UPI000B7DCBEB|nr:SDR family NAD(P)-dependent oxidoreductase [Paenibacillus sp. SSG-1]OXL85623.1 oxidoreductase [Paenibacillus sp. SSG-1]
MQETNMDFQNKVVLITGGTSGVGKAIALGLARLGAKIVIISRNHERGQEALHDIAKATGNEKGEFMVADLSLQSSIRKVSEEFKRKYDHLHVLANVGGAVYFEKQLTSEGIERTFALNYLSHFLLTNELLDMLKESRPSRVITVSGAPRFLKKANFNVEDVQLVNHFSGLGATAQALFARVIFTYELTRRLEGTGVRAFTFHPGLVQSNLTRNAPWYIKAYGKLANRRAKEDCEIGVYLAAAKEVENVNGVFFDDQMQMMTFPILQDEEMGRRLWSISEELTGVSKM